MKGIKCQVCGEPFNRYSWKSQQKTCPECLKKPRQKTQAVGRLKSGKHHSKYTANKPSNMRIFLRSERKRKDPVLYKKKKKFHDFSPTDIYKDRIYKAPGKWMKEPTPRQQKLYAELYPDMNEEE